MDVFSLICCVCHVVVVVVVFAIDFFCFGVTNEVA